MYFNSFNILKETISKLTQWSDQYFILIEAQTLSPTSNFAFSQIGFSCLVFGSQFPNTENESMLVRTSVCTTAIPDFQDNPLITPLERVVFGGGEYI